MNVIWLGGLFDGEGSVATRLRPPSAMVVQLTINMTDLRTIDEVDRILTGNKIRTSRTAANNEGRKRYHMLVVCDHDSITRMCYLLIPHTLTKRSELLAAKQAIAIYRAVPRNLRAAYTPNIYKKMRDAIDANRLAS